MKNSLLSKVMEMGRVKSHLGILQLSDEEAYKHCISVAQFTQEYLDIEKDRDPDKRNDEDRKNIIMGALIHDIGKAFLPFGLQHSSNTFTMEQKEVMKMHPLLGYVAIQNCQYDKIVNNIVLMHHSNLDGSGYPTMNNKRYGDMVHYPDRCEIDVPEYVWIVTYADRLDAMINQRPYKKNSMSLNEAWKELVILSKKEILPYDPLLIYRDVVRKKDIFEGGDYETT